MGATAVDYDRFFYSSIYGFTGPEYADNARKCHLAPGRFALAFTRVEYRLAAFVAGMLARALDLQHTRNTQYTSMLFSAFDGIRATELKDILLRTLRNMRFGQRRLRKVEAALQQFSEIQMLRNMLTHQYVNFSGQGFEILNYQSIREEDADMVSVSPEEIDAATFDLLRIPLILNYALYTEMKLPRELAAVLATPWQFNSADLRHLRKKRSQGWSRRKTPRRSSPKRPRPEQP